MHVERGSRVRAGVAGALAVGGVMAAVCHDGPSPRDPAPTRDRGDVAVDCEPIRFMVSLNEDDDDGDGREDRTRALDPAAEDNLRTFVFDHAGAAEVFVSRIVVRADQSPAVDDRVRAYEADRRTPFDFDRRHAVPATLHLEGVEASPDVDDLGFEWQFHDGTEFMPCGGGARGSVVDLDAQAFVDDGRGSDLRDHHKMLVTGSGETVAEFSPAVGGSHRWAYPGDMTFDDADALRTGFTAGTTWTPVGALHTHHLRLELTRDRQVIESLEEVNLTAPRHLDPDVQNRSAGVTTGWHDANPGPVTLFKVSRIRYDIQDQERASIRQSAYGGRTPQIRENIGTALTSPHADVQDWLDDNLQHSPDWTDQGDGEFTDRLEASQVPTDIMTVNNQGRLSFLPALQAAGAVLMEATPNHVWQLSVNGAVVADGTDNPFSVTVHDTRQQGGGTQLRFRSEYTIVTP